MTTVNIGACRFLSLSCAAALAVSLWASPGGAKAGPDVDGAVDALISAPLNTLGDLAGSLGLITGAVGGTVGDLVALLDDNEYSRVVLRGFISTTIQRITLGLSQTMTGAMEGNRGEDFDRYPEAAGAYLTSRDTAKRLETLEAGLGAIYVAVTDAIGQPLLVLTKGAGAQGPTDQIESWQKKVRERYLGSVRGGM